MEIRLDNSFYRPAENYLIFIAANGDEVGKLVWSDGKLRFTGNADEAAKLLFETLQSQVDSYMASRWYRMTISNAKLQAP